MAAGYILVVTNARESRRKSVRPFRDLQIGASSPPRVVLGVSGPIRLARSYPLAEKRAADLAVSQDMHTLLVARH